MAETSIEWTHREGTRGATWNPLRGCSEISPGCLHCYAAVMAYRFSGPGQPYEGLVKRLPNGKIVWTGRIRTVPEKLGEPLRTKAPTTYFVNSMSDLWHEDVPDDFVGAVFGVMAACPWHTFQVLTKRAERLPRWFEWFASGAEGRYRIPAVIEHAACVAKKAGDRKTADRLFDAANRNMGRDHWPLSNVWLGVSVEDQKRADERIPHLLKTPAAVRFLSVEPLLSDLNLDPWLWEPGGVVDTDIGPEGYGPSPSGLIDWIIIGGESGPNARPFDIQWARSIVAQCKAADVPVFVKQLGSRPIEGGGHYSLAGPGVCMVGQLERPIKLADRKGGNWFEWPADLRVREFPQVPARA
jgi:protein gp37